MAYFQTGDLAQFQTGASKCEELASEVEVARQGAQQEQGFAPMLASKESPRSIDSRGRNEADGCDVGRQHADVLGADGPEVLVTRQDGVDAEDIGN